MMMRGDERDLNRDYKERRSEIEGGEKRQIDRQTDTDKDMDSNKRGEALTEMTNKQEERRETVTRRERQQHERRGEEERH